MRRNAEEWVDIAKGLSIIGVVVIHVLGFLEQMDPLRLNVRSYLVLDQISRFSVPVFVAVSGYALTKSSLTRPWTIFNIKQFYGKRFWRVLPLYFFWTVIILLISSLAVPWAAYVANSSIWVIVLLGQASYHLYFVPMILQLYILLPALLIAVKKFGRFALLTALGFQIGWFEFMGRSFEKGFNTVPFSSDQQQYIFFASWVFYFVLGIWLALNGQKLKNILLKVLLFLLFFCSLWWNVFSAQEGFGGGVDLLIATRFTRLSVLMYGTLFILILWTFKEAVGRLVVKGWLFGKFLMIIGRESYLIYLCHTTILLIFFSFVQRNVERPILFLASAIVFITIGVSLKLERR